MPPTRHVVKERRLPKSPKQHHRFTFPANNHLLVTTASHIYAWDSAGIHTIFKSSKSSIVAAREAKDGSGVLAVADKHTVVLHDTKRGQGRSWGLEADDDEVRNLEYTADTKSLFLSTNLTADIHRYSTERSKLLAPSRAHGSPPVALGVSPTGHLLVSASENPPVVYLKDLKQNGEPTMLKAQASNSAVSKIAFHPERANIFALAFRDGTVASYDATKMRRNEAGSLSNQERMNGGEISRLPGLHRTTSETANSPSVSDVAFLPGYKTRAITTGSDGRCRLVDFVDGGAVLRTWHVKAPITSLSILSQKTEGPVRKASTGRSTHTLGGPTSTNNLVAVGRADGKVHLYDSVGLLLHSKTFSEDGERVISVEWVKGSSPRPMAGSVISEAVVETKELPHFANMAPENAQKTSPLPPTASTTQERRGTTFEHVGLPPALRRPKEPADQASTAPPRKFTIHPDEMNEGTVRHTPAPNQAKPKIVGQNDYLDLFSPTKQPEEVTNQSPVKRLASPPRSRPRLSPQTFVKSPEATPAGLQNTVAKPRNLALFPSTESSLDNIRPVETNLGRIADQGRGEELSTARRGERITFKMPSQRRQRTSSSYRIVKPSPNKNAKVLADLRKMSTIHPAYRPGGTLAAFGTSKPADSQKSHNLSAKESLKRFFRRSIDHVETDLDSEKALKAYEHVHKRSNWPEDSNQDPSLDGDIWLTSDSENDTVRRHRRRKNSPERPPARQTSRSRVTSKGTTSTIGRKPVLAAAEPLPKKAGVDGSTDEDMLSAQTHVSPSGAFSPSSNDVRDLFPRSSSLSPQKGRKSRKRMQVSAEKQQQPLREVALNSISERQAKSPWARAKAGQSKNGVAAPRTQRPGHVDIQILEDQAQGIAEATNSRAHCSVCTPTQARVNDLEGEVARLKGEVIALKAVLRGNGISLPISMR